jgi:hypothetical protein
MNLGAVNVAVTDADIERAFRIAADAEGARARFHAAYVLPITDPTIERCEVITEFRRFVLASEEQARLGNWMVARGARDLRGKSIKEDLESWRGRVSIKTRLRFHPQNTYNSLPPFEHLLGAPAVEVLDVIRTPQYGFISGQKLQTAPFTGADVETVVDAKSLGQGVRALSLVFEGRELARIPVDFSRLE